MNDNFQKRYEKCAKLFVCKYTRADLSTMLAKLSQKSVSFSDSVFTESKNIQSLVLYAVVKWALVTLCALLSD